MGFRYSFAISAFLSFTSLVYAELPAQRYSMLDLGSLGGAASGISGINNAGVIVGHSFLPGNATHHGFRSTGTITLSSDLGLPGTLQTNAYSVSARINSSGQIAAMAIPANPVSNGVPPWRTYLIPAGGTFGNASDIQTLGGDFAFANGINDSGDIVGWSGLAGGSWHAYVYKPGGGIQDLGVLMGTSSMANDINNAGQVVGSVGAFAYRTLPNTQIRPEDNLGSLGGTYSSATAINDLGVVAGRSEIVGGHSHVFRTQPNAAITPSTDDLGTLPDSSYAEPFSLNIHGDVVGWSFLTGGGTRAFIGYGDSSQLYDLNDLILDRGNWIFDLAQEVNDQGQIVARAHLNGSGFDHAFLLTPVPEPTGALIFSGLSMICLMMRRTLRNTSSV